MPKDQQLANAIEFGDRGNFSATNPTNPSPLLTVDPSAFLFTAIDGQAAITNRSTSSTTVLGGVVNGDPDRSISGLQVLDGRSLILMGGSVSLDGGIMTSREGQIEIGGVALPGRVGLSIDGNIYHLNFPDNLVRANIFLTKKSMIDTIGERGGGIQIQGRQVTLTNGSTIVSGNFNTKGGDILVKANDLLIEDGAKIFTIATGDAQGGNLTVVTSDSINLNGTSVNGNRSGLFTFTGSVGDAGDLKIYTGQLIVQNGARIASDTFAGSTTQPNNGGDGSAGNLTIEANKVVINRSQVSNATWGKGKAGNLTVMASDSVELIGILENGYSASGLFASTNDGAEGEGGSLTIQTKYLTANDGAQVVTSTRGSGNAGTLTIRADKIKLTGTSANGDVSSGLFTDTSEGLTGNAGTLDVKAQQLIIQDSAIISSSTLGVGNGGDMKINVGILSVLSGGAVITGTFDQGKGGNLSITASELVEISGASAVRQNISALLAGTSGGGIGGDIIISTGQLIIRNGAEIGSASKGQGSAGNIIAIVRGKFQANNGNITAATKQSMGGSISIAAEDIRLLGNSDITTNVVGGSGNGGNITLKAKSIIALNDSDILAFARDGKGGNVTLNTPAFFGQNYRPAPPGTDPRTLDGNDRVDINASGTISGTVSIPDVSFIQNGLNQLPKSAIDTEKLVSQTCIVRQNQPTGTFYILGKTNLPQRPGDLIPSNYSTQESQTQTANRPWQKGDPIVEPQGFYKLANGRLIMSRECDR